MFSQKITILEGLMFLGVLGTNVMISCLFIIVKINILIFFSFHGAQIVAITVFFLLSVAYYAFFAPFLGKDIYEYVAVGVYSVLVSSTAFSHISGWI